MRKAIQIAGVISIIVLWSCDEIDDPIPRDLGNVVSSGSVEYVVDQSLNLTDSAAIQNYINARSWEMETAADNSTSRFITLEEFTGHTCQNCPPGTKEIIRLHDTLGDQLIPVAIHAGSFARFAPSASKYFTDFNVIGGHGDVYSMTFNPGDAYPRGTVSRRGGIVTGVNQWSQEINAIKNDAPLAALELTNYFSATDSVIRSRIKVTWNQTLPETYALQVFVKEDSIVDWQKDITANPIDVPNYKHRHVLRKVVNGTFGKTLQTAESGESETIEYIFPFKEGMVPNNEHNIEVIAFIFNNDPSSYEVIQANAAHIK